MGQEANRRRPSGVKPIRCELEARPWVRHRSQAAEADVVELVCGIPEIKRKHVATLIASILRICDNELAIRLAL